MEQLGASATPVTTGRVTHLAVVRVVVRRLLRLCRRLDGQ